MAFISDTVLDAALNIFTNSANRLDITSQEATSYAQATSTYTLGNKTGITVSAPGDGSPNGRRVTISAITDGAVTGTGTAAYYAITDTTGSQLLATGSLTASQVVTNGNIFSTSAITIRIPDTV